MVLMLSTFLSCATRQGMRVQQLLDMDDRVGRHSVSIHFHVVLPAPAFAQRCGSFMGMGFTVTPVATAVEHPAEWACLGFPWHHRVVRRLRTLQVIITSVVLDVSSRALEVEPKPHNMDYAV